MKTRGCFRVSGVHTLLLVLLGLVMTGSFLYIRPVFAAYEFDFRNATSTLIQNEWGSGWYQVDFKIGQPQRAGTGTLHWLASNLSQNGNCGKPGVTHFHLRGYASSSAYAGGYDSSQDHDLMWGYEGTSTNYFATGTLTALSLNDLYVFIFGCVQSSGGMSTIRGSSGSFVDKPSQVQYSSGSGYETETYSGSPYFCVADTEEECLISSEFMDADDLAQYGSDATTVIAAGASTTDSVVVLGAVLDSFHSSTAQLQIEVRQAGTSFTGVPNATSSFGSIGNEATTTLNLGLGSYHWQARGYDGILYSEWRLFGANASSTDFIIAVSSTSAELSATSLFADPNLVSYYRFEGDATDEKGANDGTATNISYDTDYGKFNEGAGFMGTSSKIVVAHDPSLNPTGSFTLNFWVYVDGYTNSQTLWAGKWGESTNQREYAIGEQGLTANLSFYFAENGTFGGSSAEIDVQRPTTDAWHMITLAFTSGQNIRAYIDGSQVGTASTTATSVYPGYNNFEMGHAQNGFGGAYSTYLNGDLDDLAFFDRVLTLGEISDLYSGILTHELSGTISASTTWQKGLGPYVVTSTVTINSGVKVTVLPGTIIKFKSGTSLVVNGELDVQGTTSSLVYFTSYKDDSVGGNTDNASSSPAAGDWGHFRINSGASTTLHGAVVRYGGSDSGSYANIWNDGGVVGASYADISYSYDYGLYSSGGTTTLMKTQVHNNYEGVGFNGVPVFVVSSTIFNNTSFGAIRVGGAVTSTMQNNFWGGWMPLDDGVTSTENSGPNHNPTNEAGAGDSVSGYVDFGNYIDAYISSSSNYYWSPPGVYTNTSTYTLRIGSSTQHEDELIDGIKTWNDVTSNLVRVMDASSSPSSDWDIYVTDEESNPQNLLGLWVPYSNPPHIIFYSSTMNIVDSNTQLCTAIHELGHALGLAHSGNGNIMERSCDDLQTSISQEDIDDFNLLWSPSYFFDPYRVKGAIKW